LWYTKWLACATRGFMPHTICGSTTTTDHSVVSPTTSRESRPQEHAHFILETRPAGRRVRVGLVLERLVLAEVDEGRTEAAADALLEVLALRGRAPDSDAVLRFPHTDNSAADVVVVLQRLADQREHLERSTGRVSAE
jgi:hypothetical protein